MQAAERALALREAQGDPSGVGRNLRWMSPLAWLRGRREDMERRLAAALEVLEVQPPGPDLAMAYSDLAVRIGLYGGRREEAEAHGRRAVALAGEVRRPCRARHVQSRVGMVHAALYGDDALLRRSLDQARGAGQHLEAGMAYQGLAWDAVLRRDRMTARRWIGEGIEYLEPREILGPLQYLRGLQATTELSRRGLGGGGAAARWVLAQPGGRGITGVHALADPGAAAGAARRDSSRRRACVRELWEVAETCGLLHHVAPGRRALAEHAELTGQWAAAVRAAARRPHPAGRLGVTQVAERGRLTGCTGRATLDPGELDRPDANDPVHAAPRRATGARPPRGGSSWGARTNERPPSPTPTTRRRCSRRSRLADDLGAARWRPGSGAGCVLQGMKGCAARAASRRPGPTRPVSPRANSTCWSWSREGLTDAEIAQRLVLSVKTVNHHVAAILAKLGVDNRRDAVRAAARALPVQSDNDADAGTALVQ